MNQLKHLRDDFSRAVLCRMLARSSGNVTTVARKLGLTIMPMTRMLTRLGISPLAVAKRQGVACKSDIDWRKEAALYGKAAQEALLFVLPPPKRINFQLIKEGTR